MQLSDDNLVSNYLIKLIEVLLALGRDWNSVVEARSVMVSSKNIF